MHGVDSQFFSPVRVALHWKDAILSIVKNHQLIIEMCGFSLLFYLVIYVQYTSASVRTAFILILLSVYYQKCVFVVCICSFLLALAETLQNSFFSSVSLNQDNQRGHCTNYPVTPVMERMQPSQIYSYRIQIATVQSCA